MQAWASVEYGTWYARSAEFMQTGLMNNSALDAGARRQLFAIGALVLGWFVLGLVTGHSYDPKGLVEAGKATVTPVPARQMGD